MPTAFDDHEPKQQRSRLDVELDEILARTDRSASPVIKLSSWRRRQRLSRWFDLRQRLPPALTTSSGLLVLAISLAIAGVVIHGASPLLASLLAYASVAAIVGLFVRAYRRPTSSGRPKRWRGRDIDFPS